MPKSNIGRDLRFRNSRTSLSRAPTCLAVNETGETQIHCDLKSLIAPSLTKALASFSWSPSLLRPPLMSRARLTDNSRL